MPAARRGTGFAGGDWARVCRSPVGRFGFLAPLAAVVVQARQRFGIPQDQRNIAVVDAIPTVQLRRLELRLSYCEALECGRGIRPLSPFAGEDGGADGADGIVVRRDNDVGVERSPESVAHSDIAGDAALKHDHRPDRLSPGYVVQVIPHDGVAKAGNEVLGGRSGLLLVDHVGLGKDRARARDAHGRTRLASQAAEILDGDVEASCLLIQKGAGPGGARRVHGEIGQHTIVNDDYLAVLSADLDDRPGVRHEASSSDVVGGDLILDDVGPDNCRTEVSSAAGDANSLDAPQAVFPRLQARQSALNRLDGPPLGWLRQRSQDCAIGIETREVHRHRSDVYSQIRHQWPSSATSAHGHAQRIISHHEIGVQRLSDGRRVLRNSDLPDTSPPTAGRQWSVIGDEKRRGTAWSWRDATRAGNKGFARDVRYTAAACREVLLLSRHVLIVCTPLVASILAGILAAGDAPTLQLAYTSCRGDNAEIFLVSADGSGMRNLTRNSAEDRSPVWSPDGRHIAFVTDRDGQWEIYVTRADGSGLRNVSHSPGDDDFPTWGPYGRRLAFASDRTGDSEIYVADIAGGPALNITKSPRAYDSQPVWSPRGTMIAFLSDRTGGEDTQDIYVVRPDGHGVANLSKHTAWDGRPVWSPDGMRLAFSTHREGNIEVFSVLALGASFVNVSRNPAWDEGPSWSPRGDLVAFGSNRDGNREVYVATAAGAAPRNLTNNPAADFAPVWSPDGSTIAFISDRDGNQEVYVMNPAGGQQRNVSRSPGQDCEPAWRPR